MTKPILCLDFDGVLHSYTSGWKGIDVIPDPPVDGALEFLIEAQEHFRIAIYSSRSTEIEGRLAMQQWVKTILLHDMQDTATTEQIRRAYQDIEWPVSKPPAFLTIDDRGILFTGVWPNVDDLLCFKPWNKQ